jgi:hypothetical protein
VEKIMDMPFAMWSGFVPSTVEETPVTSPGDSSDGAETCTMAQVGRRALRVMTGTAADETQ